MPARRDRGGRGRWDSCATRAARASSLRWAEAESDRLAGRVGLGTARTGVAEERWRSWANPLSPGCLGRAASCGVFVLAAAGSARPALGAAQTLPPTLRKSGERLRALLLDRAPLLVERAVPASRSPRAAPQRLRGHGGTALRRRRRPCGAARTGSVNLGLGFTAVTGGSSGSLFKYT